MYNCWNLRGDPAVGSDILASKGSDRSVQTYKTLNPSWDNVICQKLSTIEPCISPTNTFNQKHLLTSFAVGSYDISVLDLWLGRLNKQFTKRDGVFDKDPSTESGLTHPLVNTLWNDTSQTNPQFTWIWGETSKTNANSHETNNCVDKVSEFYNLPNAEEQPRTV